MRSEREAELPSEWSNVQKIRPERAGVVSAALSRENWTTNVCACTARPSQGWSVPLSSDWAGSVALEFTRSLRRVTSHVPRIFSLAQ